jgi:hypothetical protein
MHETNESDGSDKSDESEWQRQEAARQGAGSDTAYRLIARTLAQPFPVGLPADFAAQVARLAAARSAVARASYEWMLGAVALALTALAAGVALRLNPDLATRLLALVSDTRITQGRAGWLLWLAVALVAATIRPSRFKPQRHS